MNRSKIIIEKHKSGYKITCRNLDELVLYTDDEEQAIALKKQAMEATDKVIIFNGDTPEIPSLHDLQRGISTRAYNVLRLVCYTEGYNERDPVVWLKHYPARDLQRYRNCGKGTLKEITQICAELKIPIYT